MTPEMEFECLVVSANTQILSMVTSMLDCLSIAARICTSSTRAIEQLSQHNVDLVIFEWNDDNIALELLNSIFASTHQRKPTIMAIADSGAVAGARKAGVHVIVQKPMTFDSGLQCLRVAHSRMVREERRNARCAIMKPVIARMEDGRYLSVTISDVSERGVGLLMKQTLHIGCLLDFDLLLPNAVRSIHLEARIVWLLEHGSAGADFVRVSPPDLRLLYEWVATRVTRLRDEASVLTRT